MVGMGFYELIFDNDVFKYYVDGEWKVFLFGKFVGIINFFILKV